MGIQESGYDPQPSQTSDPSYLTAKVSLNHNKPRFTSKVSLLSKTMVPHSLPASFKSSFGLGLGGLQGGPFQPKLSFGPTLLEF